MDNAILLMLFGLPAAVLVALYIQSGSYNDLLAIYLITVWLQCYLYGSVWLVSGEHRELAPYALGLVAFLLVVYIACFTLLGGALKSYYGLVPEMALGIPRSVLAVAFIAWLGFKALLVRKYGLLVFGSLKMRELAGVPRSLVDIDALLLIPAFGAYFAYTIQVARLGRRAIQPFLAALWIAFLLVNLMMEAGGGGKRMMILTALVALFMLPGRRLRLNPKIIVVALAMIGAVAVLSDRYQSVRENFWALRRDIKNRDFTDMAGVLFRPRRKYVSLVEDISKRPPPLELLYAVTDKQLVDRDTAGGSLITQAVLNAVPGVLMKKEYVDDDARLATLFGLPHIDFATTPLAEMQAESFIPAYFLVPALYVGLLWGYLALLDRRGRRSRLLTLTLVGVLAVTAGSFEYSLTMLVEGVRNTGLLWTVSEVSLFFSGIRVVPAAARYAPFGQR